MNKASLGAVCAVLLMVVTSPAAVLGQATPIYRSTDGQGALRFSDRPVDSTERLELKPLSVVPIHRVVAPPPAAVAEREAPFVSYASLQIVSPVDEETLPSGAAGNLQVQLGIEPALHEEHRVRLLIDGQASQPASHREAFTLTNLERGERVLQIELLDASGEVRQRSAPVTLYVQRASVNLPHNPRASH